MAPKPPRPSQSSPPPEPQQPPPRASQMTNRVVRPSRLLPGGILESLPEGVDADEFARLSLVKEVVEDAVAFEFAVAQAKPMVSWRSRPIVLSVIALFSVAIAGYSVWQKPEWVYGPEPARIERATAEANVRFGMFLAAQRVRAYQAEHGQLPATLAAAGQTWPEITYFAEDTTTFEIRSSVVPTQPIVFRSNASLIDFLGTSRQALRDRTP